jgi:hypothetical protein
MTKHYETLAVQATQNYCTEQVDRITTEAFYKVQEFDNRVKGASVHFVGDVAGYAEVVMVLEVTQIGSKVKPRRFFVGRNLTTGIEVITRLP